MLYVLLYEEQQRMIGEGYDNDGHNNQIYNVRSTWDKRQFFTISFLIRCPLVWQTDRQTDGSGNSKKLKVSLENVEID